MPDCIPSLMIWEPRVPRMLLAFPWNPVLQLQLGPNLKFESIRPAALFIAFVNPATDCVFHLNGFCRELFGCFKGLNLSVASHQNGAASWTCKCMVRKQVGPCRRQRCPGDFRRRRQPIELS